VAKNNGAVTAARARSALSAMFNWAVREGLEIPVNPVLGTNRPAAPRSRERTLTNAELAEIWKGLEDDDYGRIVKLLILTAQRRTKLAECVGPNSTSPSAFGQFLALAQKTIASILFH